MEHNPSESNLIPVPNAVTVDPPHHDEPKPIPKPPKKKRGPLYFIRLALFMMRRRSDKSRGFSGSSSKSLWGKLVDSVRPLQLELQQAKPEAKPPAPTLTLDSPAHTELSEDALFTPSAGGSSLSPFDTPYSSAVGLNEMDQGESETEVEAKKESDSMPNNVGDEDEMIDAKAEEFIANFYNEMKLQRRYSINKRSLG